MKSEHFFLCVVSSLLHARVCGYFFQGMHGGIPPIPLVRKKYCFDVIAQKKSMYTVQQTANEKCCPLLTFPIRYFEGSIGWLMCCCYANNSVWSLISSLHVRASADEGEMSPSLDKTVL